MAKRSASGWSPRRSATEARLSCARAAPARRPPRTGQATVDDARRRRPDIPFSSRRVRVRDAPVHRLPELVIQSQRGSQRTLLDRLVFGPIPQPVEERPDGPGEPPGMVVAAHPARARLWPPEPDVRRRTRRWHRRPSRMYGDRNADHAGDVDRIARPADEHRRGVRRVQVVIQHPVQCGRPILVVVTERSPARSRRAPQAGFVEGVWAGRRLDEELRSRELGEQWPDLGRRPADERCRRREPDVRAVTLA